MLSLYGHADRIREVCMSASVRPKYAGMPASNVNTGMRTKGGGPHVRYYQKYVQTIWRGSKLSGIGIVMLCWWSGRRGMSCGHSSTYDGGNLKHCLSVTVTARCGCSGGATGVRAFSPGGLATGISRQWLVLRGCRRWAASALSGVGAHVAEDAWCLLR